MQVTVDGLLVIDKPAGLTSHDVVAAARRVLREPRVGHTGTLDPLATGVLPLVVGRATRLAQFLSGRGKSYDATIAMGVATDTADATGTRVGGAHHGPWPPREAIDRALDAFRGTFLQQPPVYSAKKIGGMPSYALARAAAASVRRPTPIPGPASVPDAVTVTTRRVEIVAVEGATIRLEVDCSAGFYVRALARDLGERIGIGAHLVALRRTRSGDYSLADALPLDAAVSDPDHAARSVIPLARMLPSMPGVVLTDEGIRLVAHGRDIDPSAVAGSPTPHPASLSPMRLVSPTGDLVAIGEPTPSGLLHPSIVLM